MPMRVVRGQFLAGALVFLSLTAPLGRATAQPVDWPTRTVSVVTPFAAGGNTDLMARIASQRLAQVFHQAFVVENRVGAGGAIAATYVAQAQPDGYTLFFAASRSLPCCRTCRRSATIRSGTSLRERVRDWTFHPRRPKRVRRKQHPGIRCIRENASDQLRIWREGSVGHLAGALFVHRAGLETATHAPYRGGGPAMAGLLSGQVDMYLGTPRKSSPMSIAEQSELSASPRPHAWSNCRM